MPLNEHDQYWIAREGTTFGPYAAGEVREYVRLGNIVPSDHLRGAEDDEWTTVAAALGLTAAPPVPSAAGPAGAPAEDPNILAMAAWGLGLGVAGFLCCGVFTAVPGLFLSIKAMKSNVHRTYQLGLAGVVVNVVAIILSCMGMCAMWTFLDQMGPAFEQAMRGLP